MEFRQIALVFAACAAGAVVTPAQDAVFRTAVDLVTVDVAVLGPDGRPVRDLRAEDFILEVDGRPRRIASSQFISVATRSRSVPESAAPVPVAGYFSSNEHLPTGRLMVIAVDEAHIRRLEGRAALQGAAQLIDTLDPLDHVAVVGLSRVADVEFTRDRAASKQRLSGLVGHTDPVFLQFNIGLLEAVEVADGSRTRLADVVLRECGRSLTEFTSLARAPDDSAGRDPCPEQVEQEARAVAQHARTQARISLSALGALIETLQPLHGPKTIVLLSEGMVVDPRLVDLGRLASAARDARVTIYALHIERPLFEASQDRVSPTMMRDTQLGNDGLARVSGAGRGTVFRLVGSDPRPFQRIAEETSAYYLLAFEPIEADRDGRAHTITVKLARGRGDIRARPAFSLSPAAAARNREAELTALLRSTATATELPVRVATFVYAEPGSRDMRVVVSLEADLAAGPAAEMLFGYVLVDSGGVIAASGAQRARTSRYSFTARVPSGQYLLRVGALDPLDRHGLVQRRFVAALSPRNGIRLSDLVLSPADATSAGVATPAAPFVDRIERGAASAYFELYPAEGWPLPRVDVVFDVTPQGGGAASGVAVDAEVVRRGERWMEARARLPLDRLSPGAYTVVGRVMQDGVEIARTTRPFTRP